MNETIELFLVTLLATFGCILVVATLINYCKRRQSRTAHGLTGMCHKSGGTMCGSCGSQLKTTKKKIKTGRIIAENYQEDR